MTINSLKESGKARAEWARDRVDEARERFSLLDHLIRTLQHYGEVFGNQLAGAITYFGFLSFFPIIAIAFAAVGYIIDYVPGADEAVVRAIESMLPGMVGTDPGQINVEAIASRRAGVGLVGLVGLLYAGLGWMSAVRVSLRSVFSVVLEEKRNFILGKVVDLLVLALIGLILVTSVSVGTAVAAFTRTITDWLGVTDVPGMIVVIRLGVVLVGVAANTLMFVTMYTFLTKHMVPAKAIWQGAFIAGLGFEVLKQLASLVLGSVTGNALYGVFAIMVALLVWISYFARLVVLGACWAAVGGVLKFEADEAARAAAPPPGRGSRFLIGAASAVGVAWLVATRGRRKPTG